MVTIDPIGLLSGIAGNIFNMIGANRAAAATQTQAAQQAAVAKAQIEAEKEIALKNIELQGEIYDIEATSAFGQTLSEGLELLANQLGITQPIVLETAMVKAPFNWTPLIIGGLVLIGFMVIK